MNTICFVHDGKWNKTLYFFDDDVKEFLCLKNSSEDFSSLSQQPDHGLTFGVCQMQRNKCYKDD